MKPGLDDQRIVGVRLPAQKLTLDGGPRIIGVIVPGGVWPRPRSAKAALTIDRNVANAVRVARRGTGRSISDFIADMLRAYLASEGRTL
jgi:hypothetical protein